MKILVTGSTGQDGSYMVDYLLKNLSSDNLIIAAARRTSQAIDSHTKSWELLPNVKKIVLDLSDPISIREAIKEWRPDYFINFGAQTFVADSWKHPAQHMQVNALSLIHILEAIKEYAPNCKIYSAGSSEQFGDVLYSPQDINHPMRARSPYGVSKITANQLVKVYRESYGLFAVHGILFNHESERRQDYFVTRKITKGVARIYHAIQNNQPFDAIELGNVDAKRDWSHTEDFVEGVWKMLNQEKPKDYVLSSGETHSIREFVEKAFDAANIQGAWHGSGVNEEFSVTNAMADMVDLKSSVLVKINPKYYRPAEVELLLGDSSLARKELNWEPKISFDELVERMVKYDIENI
jgi:GDPmannose 4,6-dehydratase